MVEFTDSLALVTGAARGIGLALSRELLGKGARVILADRDPQVLRSANDLGDRAEGWLLNVAEPEDWERLRRHVVAGGRQVDILINNAGVCLGSAADEIGNSAWEESFRVNLWGPLYGMRAFLPGMLDRGRGCLANVASVAGLIPFPLMGPYCASKFALVGLSLSLSLELDARGVRVVTVCPGAVKTGLLERSTPWLPEKVRPAIERLVGRMAKSPDDLARETVSAMRRGSPLLVPAGTLRPLLLLQRLSPAAYSGFFRRLYSRVVRSTAARRA